MRTTDRWCRPAAVGTVRRVGTGNPGGAEPPTETNPLASRAPERARWWGNGSTGPFPPPWVAAPLATQSWMAPTCWAVAAVSAPLVSLWLWSTSWPGGLGLLQFVLELLVLAAGLSVVVLVGIQVAGRLDNRVARRATGISWPVRGTAALVLAGLLWTLSVGLVATDAPLRLRFHLSRPAFDDAAARAEAIRAASTTDQIDLHRQMGWSMDRFETRGRIGLYPQGLVVVESDSVHVEPESSFWTIGWFEYHGDSDLSLLWGPSGADGNPHRQALGEGWWAVWHDGLQLD